jgi:hypothetical protein
MQESRSPWLERNQTNEKCDTLQRGTQLAEICEWTADQSIAFEQKRADLAQITRTTKKPGHRDQQISSYLSGT